MNKFKLNWGLIVDKFAVIFFAITTVIIVKVLFDN